MNTYRIALLAVVVVLASCSARAQQVEKVSPGGTKFLLYTPPGYTQNDQYPLLIVLHGQGAMGDDLNKLKKRDQTPSMLIAQNKWPSSYPFVVVSPQLKRDESVPRAADQKWPPGMVDEVVEYVRTLYSIDGRRIYITGLSQGGHGSYDYMVAYPEKIAAGVLISGVPDSTVACAIKDIPVWIFHGTDDPLVPNVFATGLMRALNACVPRGTFRPHLNMLYGHKHEGWNEIYNGSNGYKIFDWMLKFKKNDTSNTPPYVSAGSDLTVADRDQPIHLYGEIFDSDGTVGQVAWTKISGPTVTLDDVHSPMLTLSDFGPGDYQFKLAATDNAGGRTEDVVNLKVVSSASGLAVTQLVLLNGQYHNLATLREGYVVDPEALTNNEINIRANVTGNVGSVRFIVNSNGNARTTNEAPYLLAEPRWTVTEDEYRVCATPYSGRNATGTEGVSMCFNIVVSTTATPPPEAPTEPEQPEAPAPEQPDPPASEEPEPPVQPEEPEPPNDPDQPQEPEQPDDPEQPQEPEQPDDPEQPQEPEQPDDPDEPQEPEQPGDPEQPQEPGQPDDPEPPQEPQQPEEPGTPALPQDTVSLEIPDEIVTGIGEGSFHDMAFYPNPASDFVSVHWAGPEVHGWHYVVISAMGRRVLAGQLNAGAPEDKIDIRIDIRGLRSGVYFLTLRNAEQYYQTRFVVESRGP